MFPCVYKCRAFQFTALLMKALSNEEMSLLCITWIGSKSRQNSAAHTHREKEIEMAQILNPSTVPYNIPSNILMKYWRGRKLLVVELRLNQIQGQKPQFPIIDSKSCSQMEMVTAFFPLQGTYACIQVTGWIWLLFSESSAEQVGGHALMSTSYIVCTTKQGYCWNAC